MKNNAALLLLTAPFLHAGTPETIATETKKSEPWIKPIIDIRARYEFGDTDGLDPSHAFTIRERVGFKTKSFYGFSALVEGEFSQAIIDDYTSGDPGADPVVPGNTVISDPETNELNQAYLQYTGYDTTVKVGRQRIIYDNAAFIGNVGWRQNEQTFDAISLTSTFFEGLTFNYAYINQVNRIFGSEALIQTNQFVMGDIHLLNLAYTGIEGVTLGAYGYFMDFDAPDGWDNDTVGITAKGKLCDIVLYGEFAYQSGAGPLNDEEALYAHVTATKTFGKQSLTLGVEHLDAGFQTPLATVHAFNGFADVFIGQRINGTLPGLTDIYLSHTLPIFAGIKWTNTLHAYGDNEVSAGLGWEYNSVLAKKFDDHFSAIVEISHFETESNYPTTTRASLGVTYTF
ncbi:MAG TPA: alginate export family protein [Luteolibacter sp.]|nr:alginate export family protein [Luteolibacter sp.]